MKKLVFLSAFSLFAFLLIFPQISQGVAPAGGTTGGDGNGGGCSLLP